MRFRLRPWRDVSIATKLYVVFGVMAVLIAGELLTLRFAMDTLSAVRAFVGGEGLWSKGQKNAAFQLQRFGLTHDEADYSAFLENLKIPDGDHRARLALEKQPPDLPTARAGFLAGGLHASDIEPMIELLVRFHWTSYLTRAIEVWTDGDRLMAQLRERGAEYHGLIASRSTDRARVESVLMAIRELNQQLTGIEDEFSRVLGEGSRWLERIIITILFMVVLAAESVGLTLTFLTSRGISKGLSEISTSAAAIGAGDFTRRVDVRSRDEIGRLGGAVNEMGAMLEKSYKELELRVKERTADLGRALRTRDEFVSIASHELKTPLSSFSLLLRMRRKAIDAGDTSLLTAESFRKMLEEDQKQFNRLNRLMDDLLDVSRLLAGKFQLSRERVDLKALVAGVVGRFSFDVRVDSGDPARPIVGDWDLFRIEQVITNLLTNAMKYGRDRPVLITLRVEGDKAVLTMRDEGIGIAPEDQARIFEKFERAVSRNEKTGLGLGLYISKEIVTVHGGSISVKSALGQGSEFRVELPVSA